MRLRDVLDDEQKGNTLISISYEYTYGDLLEAFYRRSKIFPVVFCLVAIVLLLFVYRAIKTPGGPRTIDVATYAPFLIFCLASPAVLLILPDAFEGLTGDNAAYSSSVNR